MFVLSVVVTLLLLLESMPSAVVALARAKIGLVRLDRLTRLGTLDGRNMWVVSLLGVLHASGSLGVLAGLRVPLAGVLGAAVEAGAFGWVISRQLRAGDRGWALGPYAFFTAMALAVLVVDAGR